MTEAEWLTCTDPKPMLEFLRGKASHRKLRLAACACCRKITSLLPVRLSRMAVAVAERYADCEVGADKLRYAWNAIQRAVKRCHCQMRDLTAEKSALFAITLLTSENAAHLAFIGDSVNWALRLASGGEPPTEGRFNWALRLTGGGEPPTEGHFNEPGLIRDVFGNPFQPSSISPLARARNNCTILKLAQGIYTDNAFDRLPILADALEDAGCDNADILAHCRGGGEHVRGCWVVDLILGKQ